MELKASEDKSSGVIRDLSNNNWKIVLDKSASWIQDPLYAPPVDVTKMKINMPTGGWDALNKETGVTTTLPATVEQFFWGDNGNTFGVSGNYLGVSWFTTSFNAATALKGKRLGIKFRKRSFQSRSFCK